LEWLTEGNFFKSICSILFVLVALAFCSMTNHQPIFPKGTSGRFRRKSLWKCFPNWRVEDFHPQVPEMSYFNKVPSSIFIFQTFIIS
jgi:hypothetical protein